MSVKLSFYIGAAAFFSAVIWTVIRTREYSPQELIDFSSEEQVKNVNAEDEHEAYGNLNYYRNGIIWIIGGILLSLPVIYFKLNNELLILTFGCAAFGLLQIISGMLAAADKFKNGLVVVISDLYLMPKTMKQLALVQFFTWFALFSMWIYTTSAVTSRVYGTTDTTSELYNQGANWVGVLFAVYNGFAALVAFLLPVIAKYTNRKITHMISLLAGGLGLISIFFIRSPELLILPMLGVGLAWASILAMPYAILTGSLPARKMGTYMGIFNFFIVIPQIMAASILGFMVKSLFGGESIYALLAGGVSMFIAALLVLLVEDKD
jgi:maltose/moltooligosaccharide transporter